MKDISYIRFVNGSLRDTLIEHLKHDEESLLEAFRFAYMNYDDIHRKLTPSKFVERLYAIASIKEVTEIYDHLNARYYKQIVKEILDVYLSRDLDAVTTLFNFENKEVTEIVGVTEKRLIRYYDFTRFSEKTKQYRINCLSSIHGVKTYLNLPSEIDALHNNYDKRNMWILSGDRRAFMVTVNMEDDVIYATIVVHDKPMFKFIFGERDESGEINMNPTYANHIINAFRNYDIDETTVDAKASFYLKTKFVDSLRDLRLSHQTTNE